MQAIVHTAYGGPDVLRTAEVDKPAPQPDEVLVKVYAAAVNPGDLHMVRGVSRFMGGGIRGPKHQIPGAAVAGRVAAVGREVTRYAPGDAVFADLSSSGWGGFAEFVAAPAKVFAAMPAGTTFTDAAAVPLAGVVALQALRTKGELRAGQRVLINGASGGVGTFAVQIARALGADVTGVCSSRKMALVRALGADHVIDYTRQDFTQGEARYDLIFDTVGNHSISEYRRVLTPRGTFVTIALLPALFLQGPWMALTGRQRMLNFIAKPAATDLAFMAELLESGRVVPVIDRTYTLEEVPAALHYVAEGHARGKVVIVVQEDEPDFDEAASTRAAARAVSPPSPIEA